MKIRVDKNMWRALAAHLLTRDDVETAAIILAEPVETSSGAVLAVRVIGVNYFCRLATTILAGSTGCSRGVDLGGVVVVAG